MRTQLILQNFPVTISDRFSTIFRTLRLKNEFAPCKLSRTARESTSSLVVRFCGENFSAAAAHIDTQEAASCTARGFIFSYVRFLFRPSPLPPRFHAVRVICVSTLGQNSLFTAYVDNFKTDKSKRGSMTSAQCPANTDIQQGR